MKPVLAAHLTPEDQLELMRATIRRRAVDDGLDVDQLAVKVGLSQAHTSTIMNSGSKGFVDLLRIAGILGYEVRLLHRDWTYLESLPMREKADAALRVRP